jgi:hypothetical protein
MWASTDESIVGSASKVTVTPSGAVFLLGGIVMVFFHSGRLQRCVGCAMVAWPIAAFLDEWQ